MKFHYEPPLYSAATGLKTEWEKDFTIEVGIVNGEVLLQANRGGLITLAKHLLTLAQDGVPPGTHIHYSAGMELEPGCAELILEVLKD